MTDTALICPICGAMGSIALGPPHGWREPCPHKLRLDEAQIRKLEAEQNRAAPSRRKLVNT